jgi:hypothetical protein
MKRCITSVICAVYRHVICVRRLYKSPIIYHQVSGSVIRHSLHLYGKLIYMTDMIHVYGTTFIFVLNHLLTKHRPALYRMEKMEYRMSLTIFFTYGKLQLLPVNRKESIESATRNECGNMWIKTFPSQFLFLNI